MFMVRGLLPLEPMLCEPLTDRLVEELEGCPGDEDGYEEDRYGHHDVLPLRCFRMRCCPRHLHVDERIVGDVERV